MTICQKYGISRPTYYRWRAEFGGLELDELRRIRRLKDENRSLKRLVALQAADLVGFKAVRSSLRDLLRVHNVGRGERKKIVAAKNRLIFSEEELETYSRMFGALSRLKSM